MSWVALTCPQCSAPLPRVALWRSVTCSSCGSLITKTESMVMRDTFRKALARARQADAGAGQRIECGGQSYRLMQSLGDGEISQVYLAQRIGTLPFLSTIKLSSAPTAAASYAREAQVLRELRTSPGGAVGASLSLLLPEVVAEGAVGGIPGQHALVLRHANGYWGDLAALNRRFAEGVDPRHSVWIWRRMLAILGLVHSQGWSHGDVRPEHALIHPRDHGVRLIGWASARKDADSKAQATDLQRSARVILVLLNGIREAEEVCSQVPAGLARLVTQASQDLQFCRSQAAQGLDASLRAAASAAYGPPSFVPLSI
jgi:serine/threonine protein kinase